MKIVTGLQADAHITSNDDQSFNQGIVGVGGYILPVGKQFAASLLSDNEIVIADGEGVYQGVHFRIESGETESLTLENCTMGMQRMDAIALVYTKDAGTGVEDVHLEVIQGPESATAPTSATIKAGNIRNGTVYSASPLYWVTHTSSGIEIKRNFTLLAPLSSLNNDYIVSQGTSGIWSYRKWKSGVAEVWTTSPYASGNLTFTTGAWGGYTPKEGYFSFPSYPFAFKSTPHVSVMPASADRNYGGDMMLIYNCNGNGNDYLSSPPPFKPWRGTQGTLGHPRFTCYAIGRWE